MTKSLPGSTVVKHEYKGVKYKVEHLVDNETNSEHVAVWKKDYLVGTGVIYHNEEAVDISYQKTEGDFFETHVLYDTCDDFRSVADYILSC